MSTWSLVRGPIAHLSSQKKGFVGIIATLILIPYYAIGAFTRLFMFLMFFTPMLGIFNTNHHYTKGKIKMYSIVVKSIIYDPETQQSYHQLWKEQYIFNGTLYEDFLKMPSYVSLAIVAGIIVLHILTSFILLTPLYKQDGNPYNGPSAIMVRMKMGLG